MSHLPSPEEVPATQTIDDLEMAARAIREGHLVAFPTETVYGLGADATNPAAVGRLFEAKGRPSDNPLIVHLGDIGQLALASTNVTFHARTLLDAFSPGPITVVVDKHPSIATFVTAGLNTVGIRIPDHRQARQLLRLCARPVAAPSANLSGRPSCTTWQAVLEDLRGRIDFVLKGEICEIGIESTVVDCTGPYPIQLRAGAISLEQLQEVIPSTVGMKTDSQTAGERSPGLRHAHYQPNAVVHLVDSIASLSNRTDEQLASVAFAGLTINSTRNAAEAQRVLLCRNYSTVEEYAREFYEFLREADRQGAKEIYLQIAPESQIGAALRDRQRRAAGVVG